MTIYTDRFRITTEGEVEIVDVTEKVSTVIKKSGLNRGIACIFTPGSTSAVTTTEYEPGLLADIPEALEKLFPKGKKYHHEEKWHDGNGHSHVRSAFLGPSITIPFEDGRLHLGTWQQIVFVELDVRSRQRDIIVTVIGEA